MMPTMMPTMIISKISLERGQNFFLKKSVYIIKITSTTYIHTYIDHYTESEAEGSVDEQRKEIDGRAA